MILIGYLFGIHSNRKLTENIRYNIIYRWFCGLGLKDDTPHHSTLSRTRKRYGCLLVNFFNKLVLIYKMGDLMML